MTEPPDTLPSVGKHEQALTSMLEAAERAGVPRERLIVGIAGEHKGDSTPYWTHVGRAVAEGEVVRDDAAMLKHVARDLAREAGEQAVAAFDDERCPKCGSPRYVIRFRADPPGSHRMPCRYECMDCDHKGEDR